MDPQQSMATPEVGIVQPEPELGPEEGMAQGEDDVVAEMGARLARMAPSSEPFDWKEIVEDLNVGIANSKSQLDAKLAARARARRREGQGQGPSEGQGQERENFPFTLEDTARFMASFGYEFGWILSEVEIEAKDTNVSLSEIIDQIGCGEVSRGRKLIIWVDDKTEAREQWNSYCSMLISTMLQDRIFPDMVLPSKDLDDRVILSLVTSFKDRMSEEQRRRYGADEETLMKTIKMQLLRIGVIITIASTAAKIFVIDANDLIRNEVSILSLLQTAEDQGHTVKYLRKMSEGEDEYEDKVRAVTEFMGEVNAWVAEANQG